MHAFISTPTPSPPLLPSSTMDTCLIPKIITFMAQQKWSTAFEAISTLPNPVHPHSAKTATFDDLHHINSLFEAIMHHHAYGIDANTDQTLNQLLLTALQICQTLKSSSLPSSPDYDTEYISWSPPSHISIQDHLDFYRTVIHYFNAFTTTNSSESLLIDANRILHQLSPRINNLSTWNPKTTQTASSQQKRRQIVYAVHSAQAIKKSAETKKQWSLRLRSRPPAAQSGVNRKGWYPTPSPTPRKLRPRTQKPKKPVVVVLPLTPLTQSGDVCPWISPSYKSTGEYLPSQNQAASTAASSVELEDKCIEVVGSPEEEEEYVEQPTLLLGSERRKEYFLGLMNQALQESIARDVVVVNVDDDEKDVIVVGKEERKHSVDMEAFRLRPGRDLNVKKRRYG